MSAEVGICLQVSLISDNLIFNLCNMFAGISEDGKIDFADSRSLEKKTRGILLWIYLRDFRSVWDPRYQDPSLFAPLTTIQYHEFRSVLCIYRSLFT